jgi:hypothetical protein
MEKIAYLEAIRVLVAGPDTLLRVEQQALLVLLADVVVQVLCDGELPV